ncbi:hypothetical protein [Pantoea cypripedii]|uniref:hypothetical protein n=1 Tax=Pantoea cypripedii TaxID=55209 RepID=UPI001ABEEB37|nr:hypothetical protein [Pantoea cypripedii]
MQQPIEGELRFKDLSGKYHHAKPGSKEWHWVAGQINVEIYEKGKWHPGWNE